MSPTIVRLALPVPLPKLFDYLVPPVAIEHCRPGVRVRVPFGRTHLCGVVMELADTSEVPASRLKLLGEVLDREPLLDAADLDFLAWASAYYHHPVGDVVHAALPLRLRKGAASLALHQVRWYSLAEPADPFAQVRRAPRQRDVLAELQGAGEHGIADDRLRSCHPGAPGTLARLAEKGLAESRDLPLPPDGYLPEASPHVLNAEQARAVESVVGCLGRFGVFLLEGVTGSGKTEVYLSLAAQVLARGQSLMILVPEISLTPQLRQHFEDRLGGPVALLHSGLGDSERELAWQRLRLGLTRVALGTRSLVLAPMHRLGMIVVDEEHDASFKQQEGFRYSARDLAVVRAHRAACPVLLGSATPSLESLRNAQLGRYTWLRLTERAGTARPPLINLLDISDQPLHAGISEPLLAAIRRTLEAGDQAMVFLNRRGYAPVLACYQCGWMSDCPRCDAHQTLHLASRVLWCHHCGSQRPVPVVCPACGGTDMHPLGQGTERVEDALKALFPDVPLIRVDRDATARKDALRDMLQAVHAADRALLVGTQMLAKGHHFPNVTLVGVLNADGGLFSADFRATERMAQLLLQVAGRAGRGERPGRVLIQTRYPRHSLLQTLVQHGYPAFAEQALQEREAAGFPPFSHQALLRAEANREQSPGIFLSQIAAWLGARAVDGIELWGPVPAPMARRVGRHRAHLLIQARHRELLHPLLGQLSEHLAVWPGARRVRWSLDVDPLDTY